MKTPRKSKIKWLKIIAVFAAVALLFLPMPVTSPQIDMSVLAMALGVDGGEETGRIKASALVLFPVGGGGADSNGEVISAEGDSLAEAFESINIAVGRRVEYSHSGIIVLGAEYAKAGVRGELEYLLSAGIVSPFTNLTLSGDETAREFLEGLNDYRERQTLSNLFKHTVSGSLSYSNSLLGFLRGNASRAEAAAIHSFGLFEGLKDEEDSEEEDEEEEEKEIHTEEETEPVCGGNYVIVDDNGEPVDGNKKDGNHFEDSNSDKVDSADKSKKAFYKEALIEGDGALIRGAGQTAVFRDSKLINIWDGAESRGLAWLDRNTKSGLMIVEDTPLRLTRKRISTRARMINGRPEYIIRINVRLAAEDKRQIYTTSRPKCQGYAQMEKMAEKQIQEEIIAAALASQRDSVDVILINDAFFRFHLREYNRLTAEGFDFLQQSGFRVEVKAKVN